MKLSTKSLFKIALTVFLLYICIYYWPGVSAALLKLLEATTPLLIGCAIAYIMNILMSFFERIYFPRSQKAIAVKSRRPVCITLSFVTLIAVIALIALLIIPQLVSCIQLLVAEVPVAMTNLFDVLNEYDLLPKDILAFLDGIDWKSQIGKIFDVVTSGLGDVVSVVLSVVTSVVGGVITAFLSIIFAVYLLLGKDKLACQTDRLLKRFVKPTICEKIDYVAKILNECFKKYIVGQCTEAVILGVLCTLGMWLLRMPYATMIGALIAFTALIPIAGAYIGGGIGAFMIFTESPIKALVFIVFLVILQQFEGNIIYPRVVGSTIGLPGIWVLAAVTVGGGLMGILGMLLGVPIAAAIYRILRHEVNKPAKCTGDIKGENAATEQ